MASFPEPQVTEATAAAVVLGIVLIIPFILSFNPYYVSIFISALILGAVSIAWNLLAGVCGQVSFGHAAFFGIGAYASAILVTKAVGTHIWGLWQEGLWSSGIARHRASRVSPSRSVLCPRDPRVCRGGQAPDDEPDLAHGRIAGNHQHTASACDSFGISDPGFPHFQDHQIITWPHCLCLPFILTAYFIRRSNAGLAMSAVHGDEETAAGIGVHVVRTKALALVVSAFCTAIMGAFYAHYVRFLSPDTAFEGSWSVMPIVASLFGGMQTLIGPMAGALVITGLDEFVFKTFFETGHKLFFGLLLAVVIVWAPTGLLGNRVRRTSHGEKR